MMWAKIETYTVADALFSKVWGATTYDGFALSIQANNVLRLLYNGNIIESTNSSNNAFSLNTWALYTAVVRFGGGAGNPSKIYVNGSEVASLSSTDSTISNNQAPIAIGANYAGTGNYLNMTVGAFAVYSRALTAAEVATSYDYYSNYFNDVSSIALASSTNLNKGQNATLTATVGARGSVRFFSNGKRIAGCLNVPVSMATYPLTATCTWKPTTSGSLNLSARLYPSAGGVSQSVSNIAVQGARRSTNR
jgi:hypothetical protein